MVPARMGAFRGGCGGDAKGVRLLVRYCVISDIHGNLVALKRVLEVAAEHEPDGYLCLGDIVGYGARPNECCEIVRSLPCCTCVVGNHDHAAVYPGKDRWFNLQARECLLWTRNELSDDNRGFLAELPHQTTVNGLQMCHGSLADPDQYVTTPTAALSSFDLMEKSILMFGHTHFSEWFEQRLPGHLPEHREAPGGGRLQVQKGWRYMINPGAVGQPRDGNSQAGFAIVDTSTGEVQLRRVGYDIALTQREIIEAGLPELMAKRLLLGV